MNYLSMDSLGVEPGHNLAVEDLFLLLLARDIHSSFNCEAGTKVIACVTAFPL